MPSEGGDDPQAPASTSWARGGFSGWIARRPLVAFWLTLVVALVVGIGIGGASGADTQLQDDLDQAREERNSVEDERDEALSQLEDAGDALEEKQARVRRLETRAKRAERRDAAEVPVPAPPEEAPSAPPGEAQTFSGNGSKNLGTIEVAEESVLEWTNDGDIFQIFGDDLAISVNSQGNSGDTVLPSGSYPNVSVNALGNWTITIGPR